MGFNSAFKGLNLTRYPKTRNEFWVMERRVLRKTF
jgi:hypothetical protein